MTRPRLLDLFCGAGGAAMGYHRAGFDVVGVDIKLQPNYPFEFIRADALEQTGFWFLRSFDAIHASPPCQVYTAYQRSGNVGSYEDLISRTRQYLADIPYPHVIENVVGAPLVDPVLICGSMFDPPLDIRRHRLFEANWNLQPPDWPCRHKLQAPGRFRGASNRGRWSRSTVEIGAWRIPLATQQEAMGIDWMTLEELSEAIPPAYTELIGQQLMAHLGPTSPRSDDNNRLEKVTSS